MPRANRRKTKNARKTEVEESDQFGCLAVDNLYNIYDLTDRIILLIHPDNSCGIMYKCRRGCKVRSK